MKSIILFAIVLTAQPLNACQCGATVSPRDGYRSATVVFEGRLVKSRIVFGNDRDWLFPVPEYEFDVSRSWKGVSSPTIRLLGGYDNCAAVFTSGVSYVIYASSHTHRPHQLSASKCDPTKPSLEARTDILVLGVPISTFSMSSRQSHRPSVVRAYVVGGISAFVNLSRHVGERAPSMYVGEYPLCFALAGLSILVVGIAMLRRKRTLATALFGSSVLLLGGAILGAGEVLFRNSWFSQYLN